MGFSGLVGVGADTDGVPLAASQERAGLSGVAVRTARALVDPEAGRSAHAGPPRS